MKNIYFFSFIIITLLFSLNAQAQELYTQANASSIENETNTTTGWGGNGATTVGTIAEIDGQSNYSIVVTRGSGSGFNNAQTVVPGLTAGQEYQVIIRARKDASNVNNGAFIAWSGIEGSVNAGITSTNYQDYVFNIVSTGNDLAIRAYGCNCSTITDKVYISSISITANNTVPPFPLGEIYIEPSAASKYNESNTIGTWSNDYFLSIESTDVQVGNYAIKANGFRGQWSFSDISFNSVPGDTYTITGYIKANIVNEQFINILDMENVTVDIGRTPTTSYTPFTYTAIATGTTFRLRMGATFGTPSNDYLLLDDLSVVCINHVSDSEAPTASTLSSSSQTDTTVDLSWSGATDNIGVTGYKVYKDGALETTLGNVNTYQVTGLTVATNYNFTITALDGAGNESGLSNVLSVTTSTGGTSGTTGQTGNWTLTGNDLYYNNGNIGIGTTDPGIWKLAVNGNIRAKGVKVETGWADYVFESGYSLPTLEEVARHIEKKGHLINIPSAREVEANGIELGEMSKLLLEKIEELTLYILQQEKSMKKQEKVINEQSIVIERLKNLEERLLKMDQESK